MADRTVTLRLLALTGDATAQVPIRTAVIAGWTGRDPEAVERHIAELVELGIQRPSSVPLFYRAAGTRLTTGDAIDVIGEESSGEVEFVLLQHAGRLWLGVGSDHTDRRVETYDVSASKQMCEKPVAPLWWAFDDVAAHWDRLILRSFINTGTGRTLYQEGMVASMLAPAVLISRYCGADSLPDGTLMFCGTLPARGGIRPAPQFDFEIEDPVLGRKIQHGYRITALPWVR
ncbi:MAG: DUF2848 domain-containing protein [Steroidobacteraceae bacterium]